MYMVQSSFDVKLEYAYVYWVCNFAYWGATHITAQQYVRKDVDQLNLFTQYSHGAFATTVSDDAE